jgi:drug/metabolite transporter (DMT)-like permease
LTPEPPDQTDTTNGFILLAAICGAIFDWWYMRKGGRKPARNYYLGLVVVVLLMVVLLVFYGYRGADAGEIGDMTATFLIWVFGIWEMSRWIIRRKYPRPSTKAPTIETQTN